MVQRVGQGRTQYLFRSLSMDRTGLANGPAGTENDQWVQRAERFIRHEFFLVPACSELWLCRSRSCAFLGAPVGPSDLSSEPSRAERRYGFLAQFRRGWI